MGINVFESYKRSVGLNNKKNEFMSYRIIQFGCEKLRFSIVLFAVNFRPKGFIGVLIYWVLPKISLVEFGSKSYCYGQITHKSKIESQKSVKTLK
jgi:hypothetical protein